MDKHCIPGNSGKPLSFFELIKDYSTNSKVVESDDEIVVFSRVVFDKESKPLKK